MSWLLAPSAPCTCTPGPLAVSCVQGCCSRTLSLGAQLAPAGRARLLWSLRALPARPWAPGHGASGLTAAAAAAGVSFGLSPPTAWTQLPHRGEGPALPGAAGGQPQLTQGHVPFREGSSMSPLLGGHRPCPGPGVIHGPAGGWARTCHGALSTRAAPRAERVARNIVQDTGPAWSQPAARDGLSRPAGHREASSVAPAARPQPSADWLAAGPGRGEGTGADLR